MSALHANVDETVQNTIKGGKADKLTPQDIADKHGVSLEKITSQITKGIKVEMEHTNNRQEALDLVYDHLTEFPDYYTRLNKMEKNADKELNENKLLIKRLLREELDEGFGDSLRKVAAGAMLGGALAGSPQAQATPKAPTELGVDKLGVDKLGVKKEANGTISSSVVTDGPTPELAKELALTKAKEQLLQKGISAERLDNLQVVGEKVKRNKSGSYDCALKIAIQ
jgi:hypothetical protein